MAVFKMAVSCPTCDELVVANGYCRDYTTPDEGIPIVTLNLFAMQTFKCECGTQIYTGDDESMYEYEEGSEHEEDCEGDNE